MSTELTLAAALRDLEAPRAAARQLALRSLAPALLEAIGPQSSRRNLAVLHPDGSRVVEHLFEYASGPLVLERGFALLGLARLGCDAALPMLIASVAVDGDNEVEGFIRECALIGCGELALALLHDDGVPSPGSVELIRTLVQALHDPQPDRRFQAYPLLAQLLVHSPSLPMITASDLLHAATQESDERLLAQACAALATLGAPSADILAFWTMVATRPFPAQPWLRDDSRLAMHWEALKLLVIHHQAAALVPLRALLDHHHTRDTALEALAVFGPPIPSELAQRMALLAKPQGWWTTVTQVRAAYALAATHDPQGQVWLQHYAKSWRRSIRDAVAQAQALLLSLH